VAALVARFIPTAAVPLTAFAVADWVGLCPVKSTWFKQLWTTDEWRAITHVQQWAQAQPLAREA
jgi:hypothetical protein